QRSLAFRLARFLTSRIIDRCGSKRVFGRCMTFNRFAGLGTLHALRTLVFRSRTAWLRRFQGRERDVRDESASVCLGGAGRRCIEAVLPLATDEVRVDVRAPRRDRRLSHGNLPRLRLSTQHRVAPALPLLWTPFAPWTPAFADAHARRWPRAGRAALTTRRRYYEVPDFSLRTDRAFRRGLIAQPSPPALRPQPRHEHHHRERNEISPGQTLLCPSVPPAHTVCLNALRRYFLRLKAAGSDQRARGRPVRQALAFGYGPEVRRKPFGFHLAMDTLPSACIAARGRRVLLGLLSTHPPCEGAAGLSPARETPCWAHSPNPKIDQAARR